jgi:hypothetical protein
MQIKRLDIIAADDGAAVSSMAGPALEGKLSLIGGGPSTPLTRWHRADRSQHSCA